MGFSVSGAAAIIFASLFIAFGAFYTATADSFERTTEAEGAYAEDVRELRNTRINITDIDTPGSGSGTTVHVDNTGASQLSLEKTNLIVNGTYIDGWRTSGGGTSSDVEGDSGTDVWQPGQTLEILFPNGTYDAAARIKVVTENGVSDIKTGAP
jgi:flagellar protein FlaF